MKIASLSLIVALLALPVFAGDNSAADPAAKAEADYQKYVQSRKNQLHVDYNKFDKVTVVKSDADLALSRDMEFKKAKGDGTGIKLQVMAGLPDNATKKNHEFVVLAIRSFSENGRYLSCHEFNWLVDGGSLKWDSLEYGKSVVGSESEENFNSSLSEAKLEKLVAAKTIECKICNDEFVFGDKQRWVMRWVAERMREVEKQKKAK